MTGDAAFFKKLCHESVLALHSYYDTNFHTYKYT
jgi:hypothetical protein